MKSMSDDTQEVRKLMIVYVCKKIGCIQNMYHAWILVHICHITCLVKKGKSLHATFS